MKKFEIKSYLLYNANMDKLIEKLEIYRLENRVGQKQLADLLHVHFSTVNRWLNGKTTPNKIQRYHIKKLLENSDNAS
jgi:transcriptional regulator with XRE-family HTH domain